MFSQLSILSADCLRHTVQLAGVVVHSGALLENVEHCGGEPEQAATMATHE